MGTISKKSKLRSQKNTAYSYVQFIVNVSLCENKQMLQYLKRLKTKLREAGERETKTEM